ncbi:MAG: glycosyltransferase family 39 protein [Anaerolineales bacterium]|nr:glycosyltransferase family 39 protein [Anaerolineales bacterium]
MPEKPFRKIPNWLAAALIALFVLILLLTTNPDIGVTWDEPAYINASESYSTWVIEFFKKPAQMIKQESIDQYWAVGREHPPLDKVWSGLIWQAARHFTDDLTAHRLGNMILSAALAGLLYLLIAENYGWRAGLFSAAFLISLPRFFFHMHLAALGVPAAAMIFATVFVFWKTKDNPDWKSVLALGTVWGLAVATKVNGVFVMPALFVWVWFFKYQRRMFLYLLFASLVAFVVFVLTWPWLYYQTGSRIWAYVLMITVEHIKLAQFYLHKLHIPPPWHFATVMFVAVTPLAMLLSWIVGIIRSVRERKSNTLGFLFLINAIFPIFMVSIGVSSVFDNERLFMPAFIFVAGLAGIGLDCALSHFQGWLSRIIKTKLILPITAAALILAFLPQMISAARLYPHLLSYYSASVGGLPGATEFGLETTYWCETYTEGLEYLNQHAEAGDVVWVDPFSHDVLFYYMKLGRLRDDLYISAHPQAGSQVYKENAPMADMSYQEADFIFLQYRQSSTTYLGWAYPILAWLEDKTPVLQISHQSIPLFEVYHFPDN